MGYFNGSVVGEGSGPGGLEARRIGIVVGNALNGDTIYNCDYLDPGDGTGIALAMAYAVTNASKKYLIRLSAGTYTLTAANPLITVPVNVHLVGCGKGITTIVGTAVSGVSPQLLSCGAGTVYDNLSLVSPTNVTSQSTSSAGFVGVGVGCKFYRVNFTANISASVALGTTAIFRYLAAASPEDVEFHNCEVEYVGDNAVGIASSNSAFTIRATTAVTTTRPVRYVNCTVVAVGAAGAGVSGITAFAAGPHVEVVNCAAVRCTIGLSASPGATYTVSTPGPLVLGLRVDFVGLAIAKQASAFTMTSLGTATMTGTCVQGLRVKYDANGNSDSRAVFIRAGTTMVMQGVSIDCQAYHPTAGSGGVEIYAADSSVWNNVTLCGQLSTGDVTVVNGTGSVNGLKIIGTTGRTLTLVACCISAVVDPTSVFTTITDGGTLTYGVAASEVQVITSGTSATIRANATMIYVDTSAGAFLLTMPAISIGKPRLIQKTSVDVNLMSLVRAGTEFVNGVQATYALPGSNSAAQAAWTLNDYSATQRWVS